MFSAVILMSLFQFFFITFPSHYEGLPCLDSYMTLGETFILPKVNVKYSLNILKKIHFSLNLGFRNIEFLFYHKNFKIKMNIDSRSLIMILIEFVYSREI